MRKVLFVVGLWLAGCGPTSLPDSGMVGFDPGPRPDAGTVPVNESLTEWVTKGAETKLAAALEAGTIDEPTAALYGALAQLAPSQLPPQFQPQTTEVVAPSFGALVRAAAFVPDYTPAQRAVYDALTASPGTPQFRSFAAAESRNCWEARLNGTTTTQLVTQTTSLRFLVITNRTGADTAPALSVLAARLDAALESEVTIDDGALKGRRKLKDHFELAAATLGGWGFTPPSALPAVAAAGGQVPVVVTDCTGTGFTENGGASATGEVYLSLPSAFEDAQLKKVILPHELAHLFTWTVTVRNPHDAWPFEAIAVALEDELVRDVHRWTAVPKSTPMRHLYGPMNRQFWCPEEPFHSNNHGPCMDAWEGFGGKPFPGRVVNSYAGDYSRFVFFKWHLRRSGGQPPALAAWWRRYEGARGDPRMLVSLDDLSAFNDDLTSLFEPGANDAFTERDRALFIDPFNQLDLEPGLRERYTFRFERERYASGLFRIAPSQEASASEPKQPDSQRFQQLPASTHRLLIELPDLPFRGIDARLASLVYEHTGPQAKLAFHYLVEGPGGPSRLRLSATLPELLDAEPGWLPISPTETASRFLLVTSTVPPATAANKTRSRWGVSIPHLCEASCLAHYRPQVEPRCCPDYCRDAGEGCAEECRTANVQEGPQSLCTTVCFGKNEAYSGFDGTPDGTVGATFCGPAGVPESSLSGLVPLEEWLPVTCADLNTPPN